MMGRAGMQAGCPNHSEDSVWKEMGIVVTLSLLSSLHILPPPALFRSSDCSETLCSLVLPFLFITVLFCSTPVHKALSLEQEQVAKTRHAVLSFKELVTQ